MLKEKEKAVRSEERDLMNMKYGRFNLTPDLLILNLIFWQTLKSNFILKSTLEVVIRHLSLKLLPPRHACTLLAQIYTYNGVATPNSHSGIIRCQSRKCLLKTYDGKNLQYRAVCRKIITLVVHHLCYWFSFSFVVCSIHSTTHLYMIVI